MVIQNLLEEKNDLRNLILHKKYNCHNKASKPTNRSSRFCGTSSCYVDASVGRWEEKMNKKLLISIILFLCSFFCFAQIINSDYFPKDNEIDKQFEIDMQKFVTNYEWQVLIGKYIDLWKTQMNLEMERLISIIPESENEIRENQKKWEEVVQDDYKLVYDNVDVNFVGREIYIGEFTGGKISLYRERAKYYLCLYYTILDQTSEDYCYTDKNGTHLAR